MSEQEDRREFQCDLCIIGAGVAGLVLVRALEGSGLDIVVAESGGQSREAEVEALNLGEAEGLPHTGVRDGRARGVGGTTRIWGGQLVRYDASDLASRFWVPYSGWPLSLDELNPYYERTARLLGVKSTDLDIDLWKEFGEPGITLAPELTLGHTVVSPKPRLGLVWRKYLDRAPGVTILQHATVVKLVMKDGDRVDHAVVKSLTRKTATISAKAFVCCGGGIENPRLLLASNDVHRNGIGNAHDLVGRFFQDHPVTVQGEIQTGRSADLYRMLGVYSRLKTRFYPRLKLSERVQTSEQVLNCAALIVPELPGQEEMNALLHVARDLRRKDRPANVVEAMAGAPRGIALMARVAGSRLLSHRPPRLRPKVLRLMCIAEQEPNPASRVTLSRNVDPLGMPVSVLDWRLGELDGRTISTMTRVVDRALAANGLGRVVIEDGTVGHLNHHIGTTRMSVDPKQGVVDQNCKVHGAANVFVGGSSVFPTGGVANPVLTMAALSMRLADHLRQKLSR